MKDLSQRLAQLSPEKRALLEKTLLQKREGLGVFPLGVEVVSDAEDQRDREAHERRDRKERATDPSPRPRSGPPCGRHRT